MTECCCLKKRLIYEWWMLWHILEHCDGCTALSSFKSSCLVAWRSCQPLCAAPQCLSRSPSARPSVSWQVFPVHAFWVFGGQASCDEVWQGWVFRCQKGSTTSRVSGSVEESKTLEEVGTLYGFGLLAGTCWRCFQLQIWRFLRPGVPCFGLLSKRSRPFPSTCWSWFGFHFGAFVNSLGFSPAYFFAKNARLRFETT